MTEKFTGRKTAFVASLGREKPKPGARQLNFFGLGVVFSPDTMEVGLALGTAFTNRNRYSWEYRWQRKKHQITELTDAFLADFKWYDLAALPDVLRVPGKVIMQRIQESQSAHMLYKPNGFERLGKARREGIEWDDRKMTIGEWCDFLGVRYTTMCARLSNPDMPMEKVMSPERVLSGKQRNTWITPDIRYQMIANGVTYQTFYGRMKAGWKIEDAVKRPRRYNFKGIPMDFQPQQTPGQRLQPHHLKLEAQAKERVSAPPPAPQRELPPLDPSKVSFDNLDDISDLLKQPGEQA